MYCEEVFFPRKKKHIITMSESYHWMEYWNEPKGVTYVIFTVTHSILYVPEKYEKIKVSK